MAEKRFFIGPPNFGLQRDVKSWLVMDDAFRVLRNMYVWRGSLRKRVGARLLVDGDQLASRLRIDLGDTDGNGDISTTVPGVDFNVGQLFSVGTELFTVYQTGTPAAMYTTGSATVSTYNTTTGALVINGAAATTACYFYPALPVMGLITFETDTINEEFPVAFDTQFSYKRSSGAWERLTNGGADALWTGTNSNFFWGANYRADTADENVLFVTNFVEADGIRIYNDEAVTINAVAKAAETWTKFTFTYSASANTDIITAKLIFYFKDRLILLNVKETAGSVTVKHFPNRCRYSQNGSPFESDAWHQAPETYGKGGFIDAPTTEAIVTAQFLKDRLIVYFERSTYELVYTGNKVLPFVWQKINTELGAESTFSQVPFDNVVLGVGNVGIHACDGNSVVRIDDKIPQEVFKVRNPDAGLERVTGIREYHNEMVYWTFPDENNTATYPNRVLVYNYKNGSWAFNDDSITAFGYWQPENADEIVVWQTIDSTWEEYSGIWGSGIGQQADRFVLAGNQEGFTFFLSNQTSGNSPSLQITNFVDTTNTLTAIDHNLQTSDDGNLTNSKIYIYITAMQGITSLNDSIFEVGVEDTDTLIILNRTPGSNTYTGGGLITRVSKVEIWTKDFNFFNEIGRNVAVNRIAFYVDTTDNGELTVIPVASDSEVNLAENADGSVLNPVLGTNILETKRGLDEAFPNRSRAWRSVFFNAQGESVQFRFYYNNSQATDPTISMVDFQLNAFIIYAEPTADR